MFGSTPRSKTAPRAGKTQAAASKDAADHCPVGQRVRTLPKGLPGVVRFVGMTRFSQGLWVGVELDACDGRNDGEVQGTRYFACAPGHGVFVRTDSVAPLKGDAPLQGGLPGGAPSFSSPTVRDRRRPNAASSADCTSLARKASNASLTTESLGSSQIPTTAWGAGSDAGGGVRKPSDKGRRAVSDEQLIGQVLASEAFSRILTATVANRVRIEMANRDTQEKLDTDAILDRMCELEQMIDDAGGAMDDIASMVQTISENVEGASAEPDSREAAAGGGGSGGGGDAGGGGRDDARVAALTKLLCTVHDMSSQAAELLRSERSQNQIRVQYLTNRVQELEAKNRNASSSPTPMEG
ncbi:unnamed protein product [Pylaiella littoralis]